MRKKKLLVMLIALLALLGVNLIVIVVPLAGVLSRKRWITRQPGAFRSGAVRIVDGEAPGLDVKWKCGYGRWSKKYLSGRRHRSCSATNSWWRIPSSPVLARPSRAR